MSPKSEKKPLFSLISVTKNNLSGLQKTYKSIQKQYLIDFEWLIIDGNSTDGTPEWIKNHAPNGISEPDNGIYDAMNKGIERAGGQYLLFLNAGDALAEENTLQKLAATIEKSGAPDFIYGDSYEDIAGAKPFYKTARSHSSIARGMFTHHQAMLYNADAIGGLRYDLRYKLAADYDFTARFLSKINVAHKCPFPICIFESGGVSQTHAADSRAEEAQIREDLKLGSPLTNKLTLLRQRAALTVRQRFPSLYVTLKSYGNNEGG